MEKIAAFVEGHTEARFIEATYGRAIIQRPFPNGKGVELQLIVDSIVDALGTLGGDIRRVLVLLDREKREENVDHIVQFIIDGISERSCGRSIYVGVSDIQIENWILSDEILIRSKFCNPAYVYEGDGRPGKRQLDNLSGSTVRAPRDKALLLKECSAIRGASNSPSLNRLVASIDFDWYWAHR